MKKAIMKLMKGEEVVDEIVGGYVSADENRVVMVLPEGGTAYFPKDDDHWLELTDEVFVMPEGVKVKLRDEPKDPPKAKAPVAPSTGLKPVKAGSPLETIIAICKANPTMKRKDILPLIKAALPDKTEGFCSTYHNMAQKYL